MKKMIFLNVILAAALLLSACSTGQGQAVTTATGSSTPGSGEQSLGARQLAVGILSLEAAGYPLDTTQAAELLPLWKGVRYLINSDTDAAEEMTGVVKQIQDALSADQLQAIQTLDPQTMAETTQKLGISMGGSARPAGDAETTTSSAGGGPMAGGPPDGGGFPGGDMGGGPGMMGAQSSEAQSSLESAMPELPAALLEAVIQFLTEAAQ